MYCGRSLLQPAAWLCAARYSTSCNQPTLRVAMNDIYNADLPAVSLSGFKLGERAESGSVGPLQPVACRVLDSLAPLHQMH